jgi:hypothetical protein
MAGLHARHPQIKFLAVLNDYYASSSSVESYRLFLKKNNVHDAVVGFATTYSGCEPGWWFPLGTVRVERVLPQDGTEWFRAQGIRYVVVEDLILTATHETIAQWMQREHGSLVDELFFTKNPGAPPGHIYLVHLSYPAETGPMEK